MAGRTKRRRRGKRGKKWLIPLIAVLLVAGVWLYNQRLYLIVVDPGHGGSDPGAVADQVQEKEINLAVASQLAQALRDEGYHVYLLRDDDRTLDKTERAAIANRRGGDLYISIHCNSSENTKARGIETYYKRGDKASHKLAQKIQERLVAVSGSPDRGIAGGNFTVLNRTKMPAVLLELGFISNNSERARLTDADEQSKMVGAIVEAVRGAGD